MVECIGQFVCTVDLCSIHYKYWFELCMGSESQKTGSESWKMEDESMLYLVFAIGLVKN